MCGSNNGRHNNNSVYILFQDTRMDSLIFTRYRVCKWKEVISFTWRPERYCRHKETSIICTKFLQSQIFVRLCLANLFGSTWSHRGNMSSFRLYTIIFTIIWVRRFQRTRSYWHYVSPNRSFFISILFASIVDGSGNSWKKTLHLRFSTLCTVITIVYHQCTT